MTSSTALGTVLITGTSSGIGLHTAVAAAVAGWSVVATMRDTARAGALRDAAGAAGVELDIRSFDVTDEARAASLVAEVVETYGSLDAVLNNAGAGRVGTVETSDLATFRDTMEVNFFGVVSLTRAAMPALRASSGRLLTVSSVGGVVGQPFNEAYCAAKFAVEGFLESLHPVAGAVGVGVCVIEPAAVGSEFLTNVGVDPAALVANAGPYAEALGAYLARTATAFASAQPVAEVAAVIVEALGADSLPFRIQTGDVARRFAGIKLADLDGSVVTGATRGWVTA